MAFTDSVLDGGEVLLKIEDDVVACSTSHSIELTNSVREISCKGSGDFTSAEYGRFSWTMSTDALLNLGPGVNYVTYIQLMDWMLAKTIVQVESAYDNGSGDSLTLTGECIITSISQTNPDSDNASYSVSLQGRGPLTVTEVNIP